MAWKTSHLELACSRAWPLAVATHGILAHLGRNTMAAMVDGYPAVVPKRSTTSKEIGLFFVWCDYVVIVHILSVLPKYQQCMAFID